MTPMPINAEKDAEVQWSFWWVKQDVKNLTVILYVEGNTSALF